MPPIVLCFKGHAGNKNICFTLVFPIPPNCCGHFPLFPPLYMIVSSCPQVPKWAEELQLSEQSTQPHFPEQQTTNQPYPEPSPMDNLHCSRDICSITLNQALMPIVIRISTTFNLQTHSITHITHLDVLFLTILMAITKATHTN